MSPQVSITIYSRPGCSKCDLAIDTIERVCREERVTPAIERVNVDDDPALRSKFGHRLPVVFVDGELAFEFHVDEFGFRSMLQS